MVEPLRDEGYSTEPEGQGGRHVESSCCVFCAAAVVATFVAPVAAHADYGCNGTVTDIAGVLYIDDRGADSGSVWVYQESNGQAGL